MIQRKEARMAGPNWASIGTLPTGGSNWVPHVAQTIDGHLEVFTLDSQGALWHTRQITPNGHWNPWALVAHPPTNQVGADSQLETTVNADGRLEVFTFDGEGRLWHIWQTSSGGSWSQWASLGDLFGPMHEPVVMFNVAKNADGHLELFTFGNDGALWHSWQLQPGEEWSPWASLAHPPNIQLGGAPVVGTNADGRLEVFSFDGEGCLWHIWQSSSGAGWSQWTSLGNPFAGATRDLFTFSVVKNADGHLELFTSGKDGVRHIWQQISGGSWSSWTQFDTPAGLSMQASDLTTGQEADGRLMVFFRDSSGEIWYT